MSLILINELILKKSSEILIDSSSKIHSKVLLRFLPNLNGINAARREIQYSLWSVLIQLQYMNDKPTNLRIVGAITLYINLYFDNERFLVYSDLYVNVRQAIISCVCMNFTFVVGKYNSKFFYSPVSL